MGAVCTNMNKNIASVYTITVVFSSTENINNINNVNC